MKKEGINHSFVAAIPCIDMESLLFSYKSVLIKIKIILPHDACGGRRISVGNTSKGN